MIPIMKAAKAYPADPINLTLPYCMDLSFDIKYKIYNVQFENQFIIFHKNLI